MLPFARFRLVSEAFTNWQNDGVQYKLIINLSNSLTVQLERIFDPLTDDRIKKTLLYKLVEPIVVHALHFVVIVSHMIDPAQVAYASYIG